MLCGEQERQSVLLFCTTCCATTKDIVKHRDRCRWLNTRFVTSCWRYRFVRRNERLSSLLVLMLVCKTADDLQLSEFIQLPTGTLTITSRLVLLNLSTCKFVEERLWTRINCAATRNYFSTTKSGCNQSAKNPQNSLTLSSCLNHWVMSRDLKFHFSPRLSSSLKRLSCHSNFTQLMRVFEFPIPFVRKKI